MKKYTKDGLEVEVIREIEGGYLVKQVFESYSAFDEYNEGIPDESDFTLGDTILFFDQLFTTAPIEKYADEITALKKQATEWEEKISQLQAQAAHEQSTLGKIAKFPILQLMADYLTGSFEYVVIIATLAVKTKGSIYNTHNIRVSNPKQSGWQMFMLNSDYWPEDDNDKMFMPFATKEAAIIYATDEMVNRINRYDHGYWDKAGTFKKMYNNLTDGFDIKKNPTVIAAYNKKYDAMKRLDDIERAKELQKEVDQLEKKKQELAKLQS